VATATAHAQPRSTLIQGVSVVDGTGAKARITDVRVTGDKIAALGALKPLAGERVIDGHELVLAPGFIDTHSHHDISIFEHLDSLAAVSQGVTTIVVGQDGGMGGEYAHLPLKDFFARLESQPPAVNVASYAEHGSIRSAVMGDDYRRVATPAEIERMRALLRDDMAGGALGLATGLEYEPGLYSATEEVLELAKVAAACGGRYISHIRSEDRQFWQAIDELLEIGRIAHIPVQVSHMKLGMRSLWGQGEKLIAVLDRARQQGIEVTADVYPYTMWESTLTVLYPKRNFQDRTETTYILKEIAGPDDLLIAAFAPEPSYSGKTLAQIATLRNSDPESTLMALLATIVEKHVAYPDEQVIATGMDERDVARLYRWPFTNVSSDGEQQGTHPRGFGSFTRVLGRLVREQHVLSLEEAVSKMTSLSAAHVGIGDRGVIAPGKFADLVLFDPATVIDRSTVTDPHRPSVGIKAVWVNGEIVYEGDRTTGKLPGRVIRHATAASCGAESTLASRAP
jgi:N-acyl-D-amino-acid deacylase